MGKEPHYHYSANQKRIARFRLAIYSDQINVYLLDQIIVYSLTEYERLRIVAEGGGRLPSKYLCPGTQKIWYATIWALCEPPSSGPANQNGVTWEHRNAVRQLQTRCGGVA